MSAPIVPYGSQSGEGEVSTNNVDVFVIPTQVVSGASATGTYNISALETAPPETDVKLAYDYVFEYTLASTTEAAAFCNAFDVSGANAYDSTKNQGSSVKLAPTGATVLNGILMNAFEGARAYGASQEPATDVPTLAALTAGTEDINATLTSVLNKYINTYDQSAFDNDSTYYSQALGGQAIAGDVILIALDHTSGASVLRDQAAADAAVDPSGAIVEEATKLAHQIPASNMRLYENASKALPTALLLKGGDTVVIGFSVDLDNATLRCENQSGDATNDPPAPNTAPDHITAGNVTLITSAVRSVEIALRLKMPAGEGGANAPFNGVRAPGVSAA